MNGATPVGDGSRVAWGVAGGILGYFLTLTIGVRLGLEKPAIDWLAAAGAIALGVSVLAFASFLQRRLPPGARMLIRVAGFLALGLFLLLFWKVVLH
jgi:hypothetical protein